MSTKSKGGWGDYEFTRAAYDEQREAERNFSCWIDIRLHTTYQRGVYKLELKSEPLLIQDYHLKHSITTTYPAGDGTRFESILYQMMYKLVRMLESAHMDAQRQEAKRTL